MPYHYNGKIYMTFAGLTRAIKDNHKSWPGDRVRAYAGGIRKAQIGVVKYHKQARKSKQKRGHK